MTQSEMPSLIEETMKLQHLSVARYYEENKEADAEDVLRAVAHSPASVEEIRAFKSFLKQHDFSLPPSFEHFLSLHNGIDDYARNLSILSIKQMMDEISKPEKKDTRFTFLAGEYMSASAHFVPESLNAQGEMRVIELPENGSDEPHEFENFEKFLKDTLWYYQSVEQGNRTQEK
jgi:hypothetical protein